MISFESEEENTNIELSHPDANNEYVWTYEEGWSGSIEYLDEENTSYDNNRWTVSVAIHEDEPEGDWTLEIDGTTIQEDVTVVQPSTSFTASGDVSFYLEPYQEDTYSDEETITFSNTGNVRMKVDVNYESDDIIHNVSQEIFYPGESGEITLQYVSSTGGLVQFGETITIEPYPIGKLDLDIDGNVGIGSRASYGLNIGVTVGYQGYEQVQEENYELQYLDSMEVSGDTHNNLTFYVYPHEDIEFDIEGSDVEIIDISEDSEEPLSPDQGDEIEVTVQFKSHHEYDGTIDIILDGDRYTTEIELTETAPQPGDEEVSFVEEEAETITLGIVLIGALVFIGAGRIWLNKRKNDD